MSQLIIQTNVANPSAVLWYRAQRPSCEPTEHEVFVKVESTGPSPPTMYGGKWLLAAVKANLEQFAADAYLIDKEKYDDIDEAKCCRYAFSPEPGEIAFQTVFCIITFGFFPFVQCCIAAGSAGERIKNAYGGKYAKDSKKYQPEIQFVAADATPPKSVESMQVMRGNDV